MDYTSGILDEIALEGLDGITIEALWTRLQNRPFFILPPVDNHSKRYLWNIVRRLRNIEFYELTEPRPKLVLYNRYDNIDPEIGIVIEPDPLPLDIYPYCLINDTEKNITGSCSTYYTRSKVLVRKLSLDDVVEKYGNKLVIVASQDIRFRALVGLQSNPTLEISPSQYGILERVGRARYHGEVTQGKFSLQLVGADPKSIFYFRKFLLKHGLITKQVFHLKSHNQTLTGLLLHLTRFYTLVKMKYASLIETIVRFLKDQPNYLADYNTVRETLGVSDLKRILKMPEFQKLVRTDGKVPYRTLFPDAELRQKHPGKKSDKEKMVRVLQLIDPNVDISEVQKKFEGNEDEEDDEEEKNRGIIDDRHRYIDVPILTQVYMLLRNAGNLGLSQSEIAKQLGMTKLQARTVCRNMLKTDAVGMYMVDIGRQRVTRYFLKNISEAGGMPHIPHVELVPVLERRNFEENKPSSSFMMDYIPQHSEATPNVMKSMDETVSSLHEDLIEHDLMNESLKRSADEYGEFMPKRPKLEFSQRRKSDDEYNRVPKLDEFINSSKRSKVEVDRGEEFLKRQNVEEIDVGLDYSYDCSDRDPMEIAEDDGILEDSQDQMPTDEVVSKEEDVPVEDSKEVSKKSIEFFNDPSMKIDITDEITWWKSGHNIQQGKLRKEKLTLRVMKRVDLVVETVQKHKIYDLSQMVGFINEGEQKEGFSHRMDKKSLFRILDRLVHDDMLKVYTVTMRHESGSERKFMYITDPTISANNVLCSSMVENAKFKFTTSVRNRENIPDAKTKVQKEKKEADSVKTKTMYGHKPKFNKMQSLHKFLFYLTYGYEGSQDQDQAAAVEEISRECKSIEDIKEVPFIYSTKVDWKMFVPPLPDYCEGEGWSLMFDVLMRLPLTIFMQIIRIPDHIPELNAYLNHPIKKYLLLRQLSKELQDSLTMGRRYIFTVFEVIVRLVYIGLVQFGPQQHKDKDQVYVYLNRNAMLLDTTISNPGYHKITPDIVYPVLKYRFENMMHINEYWHDLWKICMHTRLGGRSCAEGTEIVFEHIAEKAEMIEATRSREFSEGSLFDTGLLPGDRLGAAGLDSMLFAHLKRNWSCKQSLKRIVPNLHRTSGTKSDTKRQRRVSETKPSSVSAHLAKRKNVSSVSKKNVTVTHTNRNRLKTKKPVTVRQIKPRKNQTSRRPYYDQVDKEALLKMSKLRVDWSKAEDQLLILCKVASLFLWPAQRKLNTNLFLVVREILHNTFTSSLNKTSRACQRRVAFMMRNPSTCYNMSLLVEELRQDSNIMARYGNIIEEFQNEPTITSKNSNEFKKEWIIKFKELVSKLMERYSKSSLIPTDSDIEIPNTIEEFNNQFDLVIPEDNITKKNILSPVENYSDIQSAIMKVTIQSTLSSSCEKPSWSYHLFSIYQQYPEKLLRKCLNELRKSTVLSLKKSYQKSQISGSYLPLTASPYQLSISFINLIQTRYQPDIFTTCYKMYEVFINSNQEKKEVISLHGGTASAVVQLFSCDAVDFDIEIPNQVIVLDPDVKHKDETYSRLVQRYQDILSRYKKELLTTSVLFEKDNYASMEEVLDKDEEESNTSSMNYQNAVAKAASRIALYLINEDPEDRGIMEPKEMQHAHDFFVVNSCKIYIKNTSGLDKENIFQLLNVPNDETLQNIYDGIKKSVIFLKSNLSAEEIITKEIQQENVELAMSLLNECLKRQELGLTNSEITETFGSNFQILSVLSKLIDLNLIFRTGVVKTRYVHFSYIQPWILKSYESEEISESSSKNNDVFQEGPSTVSETVLQEAPKDFDGKSRSVETRESPMVTETTLKLSKSIDNQKVSTLDAEGDSQTLSTSIQDIDLETTSGSSLKSKTNYSKFLEEKINSKNIDLKTLESFRDTNPISVLMKPWVQINGKINQKVLDCFLRSVLSHVMLYPGINLAKIQDRFSPAVQPQHTLDLCDILTKLGCIEKYYVYETGTASLFSKPLSVVKTEATGFENESSIVYEADKCAIIKLAIFLDKFCNKHEEDFIQYLLGK